MTVNATHFLGRTDNDNFFMSGYAFDKIDGLPNERKGVDCLVEGAVNFIRVFYQSGLVLIDCYNDWNINIVHFFNNLFWRIQHDK